MGLHSLNPRRLTKLTSSESISKSIFFFYNAIRSKNILKYFQNGNWVSLGTKGALTSPKQGFVISLHDNSEK